MASAARPPGSLETPILRETLKALSMLRHPRFPGQRLCLVWRQTRGRFRQLFGPGVVEVGVDGMADIGGIMVGGVALQIEMKSASGVLEPAQEAWAEAVRSFNGVFFVARSPEQACRGVLATYEERFGTEPVEVKW